MKLRNPALLLLTAASALLTAACGSSSDSPPAPAGSGYEDPPPVALCGMPAYSLVPRAEVGKLVDWQEIPLLNLSAAAIDELLAGKGYESLSPLPYGSRVIRFRYTTQDRGKLVEATATLGVPANAALPDVELPFTMFLHGTTGFSDPCAPSRTLDGQAPAALLAALGFVTVAPDYIGMVGDGGTPSTTTHGYLVGEQVAFGSWDALRAAEQLLAELALPIRTGKTAALWGGSQGGHAALFTELYAPYYAPEYVVPGVVASVPPSELLSLTRIAMESFSEPTVAFSAVLATMRKWYGAPADLGQVFTNTAPYFFADNLEGELFLTGSACDTGASFKDIENKPELQTVDTFFLPEFSQAVLDGRWDELAPWTCYLNEGSLATSSVAPRRHTPTLMVYAENDTLVVTAPMREDFDRLCSQGYELMFLECQGAQHSEGATWSLREQADWLRDRIAGKPLPAGMCQRSAPTCCSASPATVCTPG